MADPIAAAATLPHPVESNPAQTTPTPPALEKLGPSRFDELLTARRPAQAAPAEAARPVATNPSAAPVPATDAPAVVSRLLAGAPASVAGAPRPVRASSELAHAVAEGRSRFDRSESSGPVRMLGALERGQQQVDRLIEAGLSGQDFTNSELLSLQASMYRYTQEVELTSKVVEKGTNGVKETVKTQV